MKDMTATLEKLASEAEDCELIGKLAIDPAKRALFLNLAIHLRGMARDIQEVIDGTATDRKQIR